MTFTWPGYVTMSVGHGTGAPSVTPGTAGLPSITGFPCTNTFVETEAPGVGITVAVVHGLLAGEGGTGHTVGFPATSPAHNAGAPPTITFACLGISVTGPEWQQVMTAETLAIGGTHFPWKGAARSIATAQRHDNPRALRHEALRPRPPCDLPEGARRLSGGDRRGGGGRRRGDRARCLGAPAAVPGRPGARGSGPAGRRRLRRRGVRGHRRARDRVLGGRRRPRERARRDADRRRRLPAQGHADPGRPGGGGDRRRERHERRHARGARSAAAERSRGPGGARCAPHGPRAAGAR